MNLIGFGNVRFSDQYALSLTKSELFLNYVSALFTSSKFLESTRLLINTDMEAWRKGFVLFKIAHLDEVTIRFRLLDLAVNYLLVVDNSLLSHQVFQKAMIFLL